VHHVTSALRRAAAAAEDPDRLALWAGTGWRDTQAVPAAVVVAQLAAALT
jgi:nitronate monooxygenase